MTLQSFKAIVSDRLRRYWSRKVLTAWLLLTVLLSVYVYASVMFSEFPGHGAGPVFGLTVTPLSLGVLGVLFGWVALTAWFRRPFYVLGIAFFIGIASLSVNLGCAAVGCIGPARFHVFADWTLLGPAISAAHGTGRCIYICPHSVELIPLLLGYLLLAELITQ